MRLILTHFLLFGFLNLTVFVFSSHAALAATKSKKTTHAKTTKNAKAKKAKKTVAKMPDKMTEKQRKALARRQVAEAKRKQAAANRKGRSEKIRISDRGIERSYAAFDGKPGSGASYYKSQNDDASFEEIETINVEEYLADTASASDDNGSNSAGPRDIYDSDSPFEQ